MRIERKEAFLLCFLLSLVSNVFSADEKKPEAAEKWKKKDIRDYTDADVERLYEQWEEADEDELEEDELPEWKRPRPNIDMSKLDMSDPEGMLKMTKKGQTLMMFASVSGGPTQEETEKITGLWQSSLFNANYDVQRYVVSENRVIFMLKDGSNAWEVKDFLVKQDRCSEVTIEGKNYPGRGASSQGAAEDNTTKKSQTEEKKKKSKNDIRDSEKKADSKKSKSGKKEEL